MNFLRRMAWIGFFGLAFGVNADEFEIIEIPSNAIKQISNHDLGDFQADEVTLDQNATLILSDFQSVHIRKLIAREGSRIRFSALANGGDGGPGEAGANGKNVRVFLRDVEGHIIIEARGGKGGNGRSGVDGRQGADGKPGRRGKSLLFGLILVGPGDDGQNGFRGEDGQDGEDGGKGGDGGRVALFFNHKTPDSKIYIDVSGGDGGKGGAGGMGGLGGNGGSGGRGTRPGKQGAMGAHGRSGVPGQSLAPGSPGEAVVYQLSEDLFKCLYRLDLISYHQSLGDSDFDECRFAVDEPLRAPFVLASSAKKTWLSAGEDPTLLLSADGQDGGKAEAAHLTGSTPPPGAAGSSGGSLTLLVRDLPTRLFLSARGGAGGDGAHGAMGAKGSDGENGRDKTLFKNGTPGTDGQAGGSGGDGSMGGDGGAGGHLRIVYVRPFDAMAEDWMNHFAYDVSGGKSGVGGAPGVGGRGGQGGKGGKISGKKRYPDGINGSPGQDGHRGLDGQAGADGRVEFFEADSYTNWVISEFQRSLEWVMPIEQGL